MLHRLVDASGVSGVGLVAEGVMFGDGVCAMRWLSQFSSTAVYNNIDELERIHGHEGATEIVWIDE